MSVNLEKKPQPPRTESVEKIKVQICFSLTDDMDKVKSQLLELKANPAFEFYCCQLPRHIVLATNKSTHIIDMLDEVLGDRLIYVGMFQKTFDDFMRDLQELRERTADLVNRLYVLGGNTPDGIREEIALFTSRKVIIMK